jgi:transcriptional regulator with XRE-family HTH domain
MQKDYKKKLLLNSLAKAVSEKRGEKSQFILACENDISVSIISTIERGLKDPQLTTIFKLAEALNLKASDLIKMVEDNLPKSFSLIEK